MASINYAAREISVKIVYYGPGLSGKTTNLQVIHRKIPQENRSDMVSLATETDRTLFFDFLPLDLGKIKGFTTKFQLYTVPGQVYYNATRKLVLRGVDGVVFVVDSNPEKMQENIESFQNLEENLIEYGYQRENIPIILQYNKRDLPNAMAVEELDRVFNRYHLPASEAIASKGKGVFESLKLIGKIVLDYLNKKYSRQDTAAAPAAPQRPAAPQTAPAQQPAARPAPAPQQPAPRPAAAIPPAPARPAPPVQQPASRPAPAPAAPAASFPVFGSQPTSEPQQRPAPRPQPAAPASDPFLGSAPAPGHRPAPAAPAGQAAPMARKPVAPPAGEQFMDYGTINLESMEQQTTRPAAGPLRPPASPGDHLMSNKSSLDLEIESYQQEIAQKQRVQSAPAEEPMFEVKTAPRPAQPPFQQPGAAPRQPQFQQPAANQPFPPQQVYPTPPQQQPFQYQQPTAPQQFQQFQPPPAAAPRQQYQQPFAGAPSGPEHDYGVYNMEPPPAGVQPHPAAGHPTGGSDQKSEEVDDTMYFTSVDTDRAKKGKKPVNPKMQQNKGLFGKLFNRNKPQ